jgi:hypothetical protein
MAYLTGRGATFSDLRGHTESQGTFVPSPAVQPVGLLQCTVNCLPQVANRTRWIVLGVSYLR